VLAFCVLTFVPFPFVHPLRVTRFRVANIAMLGVWSVLALSAILFSLNPGPWVTAALCFIAVYFLLIGLLRQPVH
jgi:phosphatidylcholine synthase